MTLIKYKNKVLNLENYAEWYPSDASDGKTFYIIFYTSNAKSSTFVFDDIKKRDEYWKELDTMTTYFINDEFFSS